MQRRFRGGGERGDGYRFCGEKPGEAVVHIVFTQKAGGKGNLVPLQAPEHRNTRAVSGENKDSGSTVDLFQLDAAKQGIEESVFNVVELPDPGFLENFSRSAPSRLCSCLQGDDPVGDLFRKINFMEGHDDGYVLFPGHFRQCCQKIQLVPHIQKRGGFVQQNQFRLLTDGPCQQYPLALSVADGGKIPFGKILGVDGFQRIFHDSLILLPEDTQSAGVGVAPRRHNVVAGGKLHLDPVGQDHGHFPGHFPVGVGGNGLSFQQNLPLDWHKVPGNGFEEGRFTGAVGTDQSDDLTFLYGKIDVSYHRCAVVTYGKGADVQIILCQLPPLPFFRSIM